MHLVDFIIRIYHDARSGECQIHEGLHIEWWWFTFCNVNKNFDKFCSSRLTVAAVHRALGISPTGIFLVY